MELKRTNSANPKIVRVSDILEQIESLNKMIDLHKSQSSNNSMLTQYEYMKNEFTQELTTILVDFRIQLPAA